MATKTKAPRSPMRKVSCESCGYTIRMARSWMLAGMPTCPCGTLMAPDTIEDRAYAGLLTAEDVPGRVWTQICRANGWEDAILRKGAAEKAEALKRYKRGGGIIREVRGAAHCTFHGCGRWVATGASECTAGHVQDGHEPGEVADAIPF